MQKYNDILLKQVQRRNLEMAKFFVDFCQKNELLCYFCGGGCIGAVRHKGFIPWDDDLDFFLPRADYEKLKRLWQDTSKYVLLYPSESYNDHSMYITMRDKTTTMINCSDEGNTHLPHFRGRGHLTAIDFNIERFNAAFIPDDPDGGEEHAATEEQPGGWSGFLSYTLQGTAFGLGTGNMNPARFWREGDGGNIRTFDFNAPRLPTSAQMGG